MRKVYKLTKPLLFLIFFILGFVTIVILVTFAIVGTRGLSQWNFLIILPIVALVWYYYLRIPLEIISEDGQTFVFRSAISRTELSPHDIIFIRGMFMTPGFLRIKHTKGTIKLFTQMTGMYEFIYTVKALNPDVQISGC